MIKMQYRKVSSKSAGNSQTMTDHPTPSIDSHRPGIMGWLWRDYIRPYRLVLGLAVLLMAIEGSMLGGLSYLIKPMFDNVFAAGNKGAIFWVGIGVAGVFSIRALAAFGHRIMMVWAGQRISARLQSGMVAHMLTLDSSYFQKNSPGVLIERVRGDTAAVSSIWEVILAALARDLVSLAALLAVAISVDWLWTLIAIAAVPFLMIPIGFLQKRVRSTARISRHIAAQISTRLDEAFHGINTIKLTGTEGRETARTKHEIDGYAGAHLRSATAQAGIVAMIDLIAAFGFYGVLTYGGLQIIGGEKTVGEFMSFFTAMALIFDPLRRIGNVSGAWQAAMASLERLRAVFDAAPTILSPDDPADLPRDLSHADIVLKNVQFSYGHAPVLNNLTFTAEAGKTTALVGPSGAGKSTIFNILTRIVDAGDGEVSIGGQGVTSFALPDLRSLYSVVSQEALLFDETLRDNILMGKQGVDDTQMTHALAAAHVQDFLPRTSDGLDSPAGPRGSNLSGGQRQRVAIARAILRNAPVLLLDEATSALDTKSERFVQQALDELSHGRTTLVIAHRLATIRDADKIVVMDQGRVIDQGSHDELLARGGLYADLYRMQFQEN